MTFLLGGNLVLEPQRCDHGLGVLSRLGRSVAESEASKESLGSWSHVGGAGAFLQVLDHLPGVQLVQGEAVDQAVPVEVAC